MTRRAGRTGDDRSVLTLDDRVRDARDRLVAAGVSARYAMFDAEVLARHVLSWDRATYLARRREQAPDGFASPFEATVLRRAKREPVAYITGTREFWGLDFEVTRDVLIPRPDTELLVEEALRLARAGADAGPTGRVGAAGSSPIRIADVGTGSGCVAVSLATELPRSVIVATDVSRGALAIARRNADRHEVSRQIEFVATSMLEGVAGEFDLIVSNPPYVSGTSLPGLAPEVRDYEPRVALSPGAEGLEGIRALLDSAASRLAPRGWMLVEMGYDQAARVEEFIANRDDLTLVRIQDDLLGIPRVAFVRRSGAGSASAEG